MTPTTATFVQADARAIPLADESVQCVVTSPPYADARKKNYGGVRPDLYVDWFAPVGAEIARVLKPDGSFVLNIKERVVDGERHPYVMNLIAHLRASGWRFVEEYIWAKKNCNPGKWPTRFRDAWERCLHFTRAKKFYMDQNAVMVPSGDWQKTRLYRESRNDGIRRESKTGTNFGYRIRNWEGRDKAYPDNILRLAPECRNVGHPAAFPVALPAFFIKLFSRPGDVILDPFGGSGTTALAATELGRRCVIVERLAEYIVVGRDRLANHRPKVKGAKRAKPIVTDDAPSLFAEAV